MHLSPDQLVIWRIGPIALNATVVFTWFVMAVLVALAWLATRRITPDAQMSRWQNLLEVIVAGIRSQIREVAGHDPAPYIPFVGTLFLFIAASNLLAVVPGYEPPTGSLSTTAALALCVFVAVPVYGIAKKGLLEYLRNYARPSIFMLPFNIIGEVSRTLALAVRLFGNIMSGTMIVGILLAVAPFFLAGTLIMQAIGLITGLIQAYIFAMLAMVYIASATRTSEEREQKGDNSNG